MKLNWQKVKKILSPQELVGALLISDHLIQVLFFDSDVNKIKYVGQFSLSPGIIEAGVVQKSEELKIILKKIKNKIWGEKKKPWIVLSLSSSNFFINFISVPELPPKQFEEAVFLNIQTDYPVPLEKVYLDWEEAQSVVNKDYEKSVFFATAYKDNINSFLEISTDAGFQVIAVEPAALGLIRFFDNFGEKDKPYLLINLKLEGIEFIIGINGQIIFMDFHFWPEVFNSQENLSQSKQQGINITLLEDYLLKQIPRFLNFYFLKYQNKIQHYLFLSPDEQINVLINQIIEKNLNLSLLSLKKPVSLKKFTSDWYAVIGTALRGLLSRAEDTIISLAPVGTEISYQQNRLFNFIVLWFKIVSVSLFGIILIFFSLNMLFFSNFYNDYRQREIEELDITQQERLAVLSQSAKEFNSLVDQIILASAFKQDLGTIKRNIFSSANNFNIRIQRVFVSGAPANQIIIQGYGLNRASITNFQEQLRKEVHFSEVNLPLENLIEISRTQINFLLNLELK